MEHESSLVTLPRSLGYVCYCSRLPLVTLIHQHSLRRGQIDSQDFSMELPRFQGCRVGSGLADKKLGRMVPSRMGGTGGIRGNWRVMGINGSEVRGEA